jgi:hypothetical protein
MRLLLTLLAVSLLGGCMWARTDAVGEAPGGTYQVSARADGFAPGRTLERAHAKALAYDEARDFCQAKNAQMFLVDDKGPEMDQPAQGASRVDMEFTSVNLRFKCAK